MRKLLQKWSYSILFVILLITGLFLFNLRNVKFNYNFEQYFPSEDVDLKYYSEYRDRYGSDDDFLLIGIENKGGVFNAEFLSKVKSIGDRIQNFEHVELVLSPLHNSFNYKLGGIEGLAEVPIIRSDFGNLHHDSINIFKNEKLLGSLFSKNSNSICIYVKTCENLAKKPGDQLAAQIENEIIKNKCSHYHISGKSVIQTHILKLMKNEMLIFFISSILLIVLFLWLTFKSWWGIVIPFIVVIISIVWSIGIMNLCGKSFDIMTVMLPTIIFVVGMSDLVHLLNKYLDELRMGFTEYEAIKNAVKDVGLATFLTSATTAIGFFTLLTSDIQAIKDFGIFSGIGVMLAYLLTFIIVPSILMVTKVPEKLMEKKITKRWHDRLAMLFLKIIQYKKWIFTISVILLVLGTFSISLLKTNNFLLEDLNDKDSQKIDFLFFENKFSGVRPFEMEIRVKNSNHNIYDFAIAKEIDKIENYLKHNYTKQGIGFSISPLDPIRYIYSIKHNNNPAYFKIPKKEKTYLAQLQLLKMFKAEQLQNHLISTDSLSARYTGKINDVGGAAIKKENEKFEYFVKQNINSQLIDVKLTGTALLIDKNNEFLAENILWSLLISCAVIALIVGLIYRSIVMISISLIVNILPLVLVCAVMYIFNIDIKISTSLIFTLAFGIAVDDTIHMISKLKIELAKGKSVLYALKRSYLSTGKAMIVTSLILCSGFLTLIFSNFTSTYIMGLLISVTLFFALLADIILLPLLIIKFYKPHNRAEQ